MSLHATTIRLGGRDGAAATEVAPHTPPTWETLAQGGNGEASFAFGRSAKFAPRLTRPDTLMEIFVGCFRVWFGRVVDYDRSTGEVVGRGIHTDGNYIPALSSGAVTRTVQSAITNAQAAPWNWPISRNGVAGDVLGNSTEPMMTWPLIEALAEQLGLRAYFDPDGQLFVAADPTTPTWQLAPEAVAFGATDEGQANTLIGWYDTGSGMASTTRSDPLATVARGEVVDLSERGVLTLAQANQILDAQLSSTKRTGWVNGAVVHREQITFNGTPAFLARVNARTQMVRAQGVPSVFGDVQATWLDVVLGKTRYTAGESTIYLEPLNTAPRTATDVWAA